MTQTGPDVQPPAEPGPSYQQWGPEAQPTTPPVPAPARSKAKKWGSLAGTVVVAGGFAVFRLTGGFGTDDPSVGDCVQMDGETSFDVVDCSSADAQYRIVGKDDTKLTHETFQTDDTVCTAFAETEVALWTADSVGPEGTSWCAVPVA